MKKINRRDALRFPALLEPGRHTYYTLRPVALAYDSPVANSQRIFYAAIVSNIRSRHYRWQSGDSNWCPARKPSRSA